MPMYYGAYYDLEMDILEAHGAPRLPQEMAKSNHRQGSPVPIGLSPGQLAAKEDKTDRAVGAPRTQTPRSRTEDGEFIY